MKNLNLTGPCNVLGYGTASYNLLVALTKLYNVAYWPIGNIDYPIPERIQPIIQDSLNKQADFDLNAPSLRIWHQFDMAHSVGKGQRIGLPIFELNQFNKREIHHLKSLDKIFVTSHWAKDVVAAEIGRQSFVVPLGVDRNIFFDSPPPKTSPFIFLNVGKWEVRKGHDILIQAFNNAFNYTDDVELWMMNHNPFLSPDQEREWHKYYKKDKLEYKVKLLPRVKTQQELSHIMRQAHCGVFPSRAEGWNMELLEMMSCGRQVITTEYSAHTEFCNHNNSHLIPITSLEEAFDGIWFQGQGQWAQLDKDAVDMLSSLMVKVYKAGPLKNYSGIETAKKFSWDNSALAAQKGIENEIV